MASLSNINGLFDVHSTGAILFSTSHGTTGQILRSNGDAAPTWVDFNSTGFGGNYLLLTGGVLTGNLTINGTNNLTVGGTVGITGLLTGTTATFSGTIQTTGANLFYLGKGVYTKATNASNDVDATNIWGYGLYEGAAILGELSTIRDGTVTLNLGTTYTTGKVVIRTDNKVTALTIDSSQNSIFAGNVQASGTNITVLNSSDPSLTVSDTDTNYRGTMRYNTTSNVLEFVTRYASTYYTNNLVLDRGNVGIGTSSPDAKLQIQGNIKGGSASGSAWTDAVDDIGGLDIFVGSGSKAFQVWDDNDQTNPRFIVERAGNVGIGTTSPSANLNVVGPGDANDPVVAIDVTNSSAFNHGLEIFDANLTAGETVLMAIGKAGSTRNTAIFGYIHDADAGNNNLATIGFWGADNKMTVSAGGNVGIGTGTTTAEQKLHVEGRGIFDGGTSSDILQIRNDNGGGVFGMTSNLFALDLASTSNFRIRQGSSVPFYLKSDGNLGIGTVSPDTKLMVSGEILSENSNGGYFVSTRVPSSSTRPTLNFYGSALDINYVTGYAGGGASTAMSILSGGNVGIGVTVPSYKLSVATTLSSGSHLNADFGDENSPSPQFVGQGGNVYDSGGIYRSTVIMAPSSGAITTLFLSTYSSGHWGCQPTFKLVMNGTYYRSGYIEYWCQSVPGSSIKYVIAGPYGTMSDTLSVTVTRLCNTCHGGQPIDRHDWSFTTYGAYIRVSPIIITNKVGRRYFNNSSFSALNTLQSGASAIGPAYFFHGLSADQAAGSSNVYTIT